MSNRALETKVSFFFAGFVDLYLPPKSAPSDATEETTIHGAQYVDKCLNNGYYHYHIHRSGTPLTFTFDKKIDSEGGGSIIIIYAHNMGLELGCHGCMFFHCRVPLRRFFLAPLSSVFRSLLLSCFARCLFCLRRLSSVFRSLEA